MEKKKRNGRAPMPAKENATIKNLLWFIVLILGVLSPMLGSMFALETRFTLPMAIILFWIAGAMGLWQYRQKQLS